MIPAFKARPLPSGGSDPSQGVQFLIETESPEIGG
jgi:hypothetical protein